MIRYIVALAAALNSITCGDVAIIHRFEVSELAKAARRGDLVAIGRLIDSGADLNAGSGVNDWPPVMHAIHKRQLAALRLLIDRGASIDGDTGRRCLEMARRDGPPEIARFLEERGIRRSAL
jgi:ankyrin repeat protein